MYVPTFISLLTYILLCFTAIAGSVGVNDIYVGMITSDRSIPIARCMSDRDRSYRTGGGGVAILLIRYSYSHDERTGSAYIPYETVPDRPTNAQAAHFTNVMKMSEAIRGTKHYYC